VKDSLLVDKRRVQPNASRLDIALAVRQNYISGSGVAVGKLGVSEQAMLAYPSFLGRCVSERQSAALTMQTQKHYAAGSGLFPTDPATILEFSNFHAHASQSLDFLGLVGRTISMLEMEPDRSIPDNSEGCYLPALRDQRVLIVSSMADLLCSRANESTFLATWAKTQKPWFYPAEVTSLSFPYAYDIDTQRHFGHSLNLLDWILERINPDDFDVALIAGGGLGIPIASAVKTMGRCAIALGGALQVLFGVRGKRWREDNEWKQNYFTDAWIDTPQNLVPRMLPGTADGGAYW
jgi:hypothetical protein